MSQSMYNISETLGYVMAALGLFAVVTLCLPRNWPYFHKGWLLLTIGLGAILDWQVTLRSYHWSPKLTAWGFPFAAAFFEVQDNGHVIDFVGPMTPFHFLLNVFVGLSLPHLFLAGIVLWRKRNATEPLPGKSPQEQ